MIYTVECSYADPETEDEWNDFYSLDKLPALIAVTGFYTSQRFKATRPGCPTYLAIHSISNLDVLTSREYREKGGGNFARWQPQIFEWRRNLYSGVDIAPDVRDGELLALSAEPLAATFDPELSIANMQATALEKFPERRCMAVVDRNNAAFFARAPKSVDFYEPMTRRLTKLRLAAAQ